MSALRRRFGMLFQDGALFSSLTVAENIAVPLREHAALDDATIAALVGLKLSLVGLDRDACWKSPASCRAACASASRWRARSRSSPRSCFSTSRRPGLDPIGARAFDRLMRTLTDSLGLTVFMVTHDLDTLLSIVDRAIALASGASSPTAGRDVRAPTTPGSASTSARAPTRKDDGMEPQARYAWVGAAVLGLVARWSGVPVAARERPAARRAQLPHLLRPPVARGPAGAQRRAHEGHPRRRGRAFAFSTRPPGRSRRRSASTRRLPCARAPAPSSSAT
jgi:energy-coupling factor transporter ATP-binding protein EcfA2